MKLAAVAVCATCLLSQLAFAIEPGTRLGEVERIVADSSRDLLRPDVAVSATGDSAVVWSETERGGQPSQTKAYLNFYRASGLQRGERLPIYDVGPGVFPSKLGVGLDDAGNATVAWLEDRPGAQYLSEIRYARYARSGARLGPDFTLDPGAERLSDPQVAVAPSGQALIVWGQLFKGRISALRLDAGAASSGTPFDVFVPTTDATIVSLAVSVNRPGNAIIAWQSGGQILSRTVSASGVLGALTQVNEAPVPASTFVEVGIDASGQFTVVWGGFPLDRIVRRRFDSAGAALEGEQTVYEGTSGLPTVAVDEDGDTVVAWTQGNPRRVYAQYFLPSGESKAVPFLVSGEGLSYAVDDLPRVEVDADGDPVFVWQRDLLTGGTGEREGYLQRVTGTEDVDLRVSISDDDVEVLAESTAAYVVSVKNAHPAAAGRGLGQAAGIVVDVELPADHILSGVTAPGWICSASTCRMQEPLPAGGERELTFNVARPNRGCEEADAVVSVASNQADSRSANDTASDSTLVARPGRIEFPQSTKTVSESNAAPMIAVVRNEGCLGGVSANFEIEGVSAEAGVDFSGGQTVTFASGATIATLPLTIIDDSEKEEPETFSITLASVSEGASIGFIDGMFVQIDDNDGGGGGGAISAAWLLILAGAGLVRRGLIGAVRRSQARSRYSA